ncbi:AAA family ATPase [Pontivivens insulae]|uniref:ATP-binding protein n=1 Tax=Pontivivens insulae TaxID=1639689 RepID=A0A2R8A9A0_9RHOB|nr:ATP-binding protein [Pontivivens insulae]RED12716.1 putative kinase [Pontivivens insulae]SPF28807.1 hypothetical protein POI8812_01110 [Pontivivens insulae]
MTSPTLHLVCGKVAAGKSTLTSQLADAPATVLLSEDHWLSTLYGPEMTDLQDYVRFSGRLAQVIGPHVAALLRAGVSVVMDFPANTVAQRRALVAMAAKADAPHIVHHLDVTDEVCLARLMERNALGTHPFTVTEDQFRRITAHFAPPDPAEGLSIRRYTP